MSDTTRQDPNTGDILNKVSDYCDHHADEKVIQFCIQHDVLICKECARDHHSECESIISINSAIKDAKYGSAFTDIETRIEQLNRKIRNVSTRQTHDYNYLSTKKDKIKNKISTVRKTINDYLDKIENETEDILNDKMNECKERIEHDKEKIKDIEKRLIKRSDEIKWLKESGTDYQFLKAVKFWDKSTKNDETDMLAYSHKVKFKFKSQITEKILHDILPEIGKLSIKVQTFNFGKDQVLQSQVISTPTYSCITHDKTFEAVLLTERILVNSGCFVSADMLLCCNSNKKSLHYFKDDGVHFGVIKLKYEPCCVTLYDPNRIIVAADNRGFQIIYLDIMSYEHENEFIKTPSGFCWTVSANSERICANSGYTKLFIVNIGGEILSEIVTTLKIKTVCLSNTGTIYWTNFDNNEIHTVQPDGKQELFFSSHELVDPRGLAVDGKCNVYVAGYMSNNIFMISKDKRKVKVILNYKDQIKSPIDLTFHSETNRLMVVNDRCKSVKIYFLPTS
ncbi:uncharacterized protein LOC127714251 [Mytilus californianus]|uniref:uncharacterized protein LOC127714251 n=1 Tax=Mytilus californianus TaxID=6549 RepID=UPI002245B184|nr:uncharacterized protein LOC127714251 [Mytilus californianus]